MPAIGDLRKGTPSGSDSSFYKWLPCERCDKERWVQLRKGLPTNKICLRCVHLQNRRHFGIIESPPKRGEIRYAQDIGRKGGDRWAWLPCATCGYYRWVMLKKGKPAHRFCRKCHPNRRWRYGHSSGKITEDGYKMVKLYPDSPYYSMANKVGYVMEHRLVVAQSLGRPLTSRERVHHKNGNRPDNRPKNLRLFANETEHHTYHHSLAAKTEAAFLRFFRL